MKTINCLSLVSVIALGISGCVSAISTTIPTETDTALPSPTILSPTSTSTVTPTETSIATLPATLEPEPAKESIEILLQEPVDCEAPCFWGIAPGQTTLDEAKNIFTHLGLEVKSITDQGKDFHGIRYDIENSLSIIVTLTIQGDLVKNVRVGINPETPSAGVPRKWSAYSLETLISRYGVPTKVDFAIEWGPRTLFDMVIYFENVELIVEYTGYDITGGTRSSPQVCPLTDNFDSVRLWMGPDPQNPPPSGVPLEDATSLTMEEFSKLITGDADMACFNLKGEKFP